MQWNQYLKDNISPLSFIADYIPEGSMRNKYPFTVLVFFHPYKIIGITLYS